MSKAWATARGMRPSPVEPAIGSALAASLACGLCRCVCPDGMFAALAIWGALVMVIGKLLRDFLAGLILLWPLLYEDVMGGGLPFQQLVPGFTFSFVLACSVTGALPCSPWKQPGLSGDDEAPGTGLLLEKKMSMRRCLYSPSPCILGSPFPFHTTNHIDGCHYHASLECRSTSCEIRASRRCLIVSFPSSQGRYIVIFISRPQCANKRSLR